MAFTQEAILSALTEGDGKIKNSDLLAKYNFMLNCSDPNDKKQNRALFKTFVNNVAVVKEIEGVKHVVLKKRFHHLLANRSSGNTETSEEGGGEPEISDQQAEEEEQQSVQNENEKLPNALDNKAEQQPHPETLNPSFIELALQSNQPMNFKSRKSMNFVVPLKSGTVEASRHKSETVTHKPYALPLRAPPVINITPASENRNQEGAKEQIPTDNQAKVHLAPEGREFGPQSSPRCKRRSAADGSPIPSSPQLRRHLKSTKQADEPKYGDTFPMEATEHKWLVTSAAGQWMSVYGLLLKDVHLAQKRDFISGFTALHWAAKCGNSDMVHKIIDLSRQNGKVLDVNTKSYAGYTPLHIAAIHHQEYIMGLLVKDYSANCDIRDNCGKKAHHYLQKETSPELLELLGGPKVARVEPVQKTTEEGETHKHANTLSRLFQPATVGQRKKHKYRGNIFSMTNEVRGEREEPGPILHRVKSDIYSDF